MIRIHVFSKDATILPELVDLIKKDSLIPVFGSGYTRGCRAHDGKVPSGDDMKDHMKKSVSAVSGTCDHAYDNYDFKKICRLYSKRVPGENQIKYFMDNFTEVQLPLSRRRFINIFNGHIYTLNIDDAIERSSSRQVILPRSEFLDNYLDNFKVVFKIHGDVHDIIKYAPGSSCGLVFDTKQYIKSLNDNKCMLSKFKVDFVDSNMAYICCSLEDEWDLLSVIQNDVQQSITSKTTYYISINEPNDDTIDILEDYGITDYILIDNIDFFAKQLPMRQRRAYRNLGDRLLTAIRKSQ